MADINFAKMQELYEADAKKSAQPHIDAKSHDDAQGLLDHAQTLAKGGLEAIESFGENLYKQSPLAGAVDIAKGKDTPPTGALGGLIGEKHSRSPVEEERLKHEHAFMGTLESAAEFWGFGKVAGAAGKALEASPTLSKVSPVLSSIIKGARNSVGLPMGEEEAKIAGTRMLASTIVGGGLTGAAAGVQSVVNGKPVAIGPSIAMGALLGAMAGVLPDKAQLGAREIDSIHNNLLGDAEKSDVHSFSNLAKAWGKNVGYSHANAMQRFAKVLIGAGSDVDRASIRQTAEALPELFAGDLNQKLLKAANSGKAWFDVPKQEDIYDLLSKSGAAPSVELFSQPLESVNVSSNPIKLPGEKAKGEYTDSTLFVGKETLAGTPVEARIYRSQLPSGARLASKASRAEYQSALPDETPHIAPETVKYVLPAGSTVNDIPAAPKLTPPNLSTTQKELFVHAAGTDWEALESKILKNQNSRVAFGKMIVHGILEPKHVGNYDVATVISGEIKILADEIGSGPQHDMLMEHANAFDDRAMKLRGEGPIPDNRFVREPDSGDIVRVVEVDNDHVAIVDKRGKSVVMSKADAPSHVIKASLDSVLSGTKDNLEGETQAFRDFIKGSQSGAFRASETEALAADRFARRRTAELEGKAPTAGKTTAKDIAAIKETEAFGKQLKASKVEARARKVKEAGVGNANDLKALEAALNRGKSVSVEPGPTPGMHPVADNVRENVAKKSTALIPESALDKLMKGLGGSAKGAISIPRGKRITDSTAAMLVNKLGGELWQVPEGIVTKLKSGEERIWPTQQHAFEYLKNYTTAARMAAEHEQVIDNSVAHLDPVSKSKRVLTERELKKVKKSLEKALLPVPNLRKAALLAQHISSLTGAEAPPLAARLHQIADPGTALVNQFKRQHAVLMQMGEGGRQLANLAKQRGATRDMISNYLKRRIVEPMKLLKKMGISISDIENGTAPQQVLDLYDSSFGKAAKEIYDTMDALGGDTAPLIEGKRYAHHWFNFKGTDIPETLLNEARQMGLGEKADTIADVLNDPESHIAKPQTKADLNKYMTRIEWARQKATSVAHALETERRGNVGFSEDLEVMAHKYVDSVSNRMADVATFGPKDEAINSNLAKIADSHPGHSIYTATQIMNDVRGKIYIPMSDVTRMAGNGLRLWLGSAGPKHLFQNVLPWMRFGTYQFGKGTMQTALHGVFFGEGAENARIDAATIGWTGQQLADHPDQFLKEGTPQALSNLNSWAAKMKLPEMTRYLGNAGTASLHVFLNAGRINAYRIATNTFPRYLEKAMSGDADALAVMSETLHAKVTPKFLQAQVNAGLTDTLKSRFGKEIADWEGMTYRPEDFPAVSRSQVGRELTRFKVFRWNLFHNIFQELNNPNYSYARRAKAAARLMVAIPALGSLDPTIRHKMGIGTIDSETAYDAWERWTKDKSHLGKAAYMLAMLAGHSGVYGLADDLIQGFNMRNPSVSERAASLSPSLVAPALSAWDASSRAAHATLKKNPKEMKKAATDLMTILSPSIGAGVARHLGKRKPVRLPKQMVIREALRAGP